VSNTIDLDFADGEYHFALPLPQIDELQQKCRVGICALYGRLIKGCTYDQASGEVKIVPAWGEFYAIDIVETVRQGLIGGGKAVVDDKEITVTAELANRLIKNYVLTKPLIDAWPKAVSILGACIQGYDPPKKDPPPSEGAEQNETTATSTTTSP
jgi:hypothetical protein